MKRIMVIILSIALLLPSFAYGEGMANDDWIIDKGYFGVGGLNLDKKMNRAELATVTIRLMGLEAEAIKYKGKSSFTDVDSFQGKWATPYIELAMKNGLISGKSKGIYNPGGNLKYVELLTVFMRVLGYRDGVDFVNYPDDHYKKALEIGLADMYIEKDTEVLRELVLSTMVKALNTNLKDLDYTLFENLKSISTKETPVTISITNIKFSTLISGIFSGELKGVRDFTGYKVVLLSKSGGIYDNRILAKSGIFSMSNFNIDMFSKITGYKYEVYNKEGKLVIQGDLN